MFQVMLNRDSLSAGFNQPWDVYAAGFGDRNGDYYIGMCLRSMWNENCDVALYNIRAVIPRIEIKQYCCNCISLAFVPFSEYVSSCGFTKNLKELYGSYFK